MGKPSKLTVTGIAAINLYTGAFVPPQIDSILNTALRDANREKCKPFVPYICLLLHALRDCPLYAKKVVFRGVKADLSALYPKDRDVTWFQFSSGTCDLSVEQSEQLCGSAGVRTLFTIELTTGRARLVTQYSLVPSEAEVLLPPNSRFKVKGVFDAGNGFIQIQLEELPCLEPILDFDAPDAAAVKAAAAGGGGAHTSSDVQQACKGAGAGVVHGLRARRVLVVRSGHEGLEDARHRCVSHSVGGAADGRGGMGARAGGVEGRRGDEQLCGSIQADTDANIQRITAQCL